MRRYPPAERSDSKMCFELEQETPALSSHLRPDRKTDGSRGFALRRVWQGVRKEEADVSDEA